MPNDRLNKLEQLAQIEEATKGAAKLIVDGNKILAQAEVKGLKVEAEEKRWGIAIKMKVEKGAIIDRPVHLCFGALAEQAQQKVKLRVEAGQKSKIKVLGHCLFPNAKKVKHLMEAKIKLGPEADFTYEEKHIHDNNGGVYVKTKAQVQIGKNARYTNLFEILHGRVGYLEIDYETKNQAGGITAMEARLNGWGRDKIIINEAAVLAGAKSRAALKSRLAVRDKAQAEVYNTIVAKGEKSKGHVDCTEILRDQGTVKAYPNVEVRHPTARVTHEARLGGIDNRQLETLMARGLTPAEAEEIIIAGMLTG